jgi:hypothetical protein
MNKELSFVGLGLSATKTGNNFDIKVLTGMKSFHVKGMKNKHSFFSHNFIIS